MQPAGRGVAVARLSRPAAFPLSSVGIAAVELGHVGDVDHAIAVAGHHEDSGGVAVAGVGVGQDHVADPHHVGGAIEIAAGVDGGGGVGGGVVPEGEAVGIGQHAQILGNISHGIGLRKSRGRSGFEAAQGDDPGSVDQHRALAHRVVSAHSENTNNYSILAAREIYA